MFTFQTPHEALLTIASFVKTTRLNNNITMEELAKHSGVGIATIARIEKKGVCSTDSLTKILAALGKVDAFISALKPEEMTSISELKAMSNRNPKKRARKSG